MIKKLKSLVSELGLFASLIYGTDRVLGVLTRGHVQLHLCHFVAQPVPDKPIVPERMARSIMVSPVQPGDIGQAGLPLTREQFKARQDNGIMCLGAYEGERLIGFHCINFGPHDDESYRARFIVGPEGRAVWDFDIFLLPSHRGGLSFAFLWDGVFDYLRARDVRWLTSYISATNLPSLKSHLRMGSIKLGSVVFLRIGLAQVVFSTHSPRLHISFADAGRPAFRLNAPEAG